MFTKSLWIVAVTFSLLLGQSVFACHSPCGEKMDKMIESLKLDDAQKAKIEPVIDQMKSNMKNNWMQIKELHMQINQQVQSDMMDQTVVDGLIDKETKMMGDMMKTKVMLKHQIFTVLNPEQKMTFQNMVKQWEEKWADKLEKCEKDD
jgi:Spy/CpxP family protein refolding chaperone